MRDNYQHITDKIIDMMESAGSIVNLPWNKDGLSIDTTSIPHNLTSKLPYHGINVMLLWTVAAERGFTSPYWATKKQIHKMGKRISDDEFLNYSEIIYWMMKKYPVEEGVEIDEDDPDTYKIVPILRVYSVWNTAQIEDFEEPEQPEVPHLEKIDHIEQLIKNTGVKLRVGGDSAYYRPFTDSVHMPAEGRFTIEQKDPQMAKENWYAVLLHEMTHWTGPKHRLDRDMTGRFGDSSYAFEELVAELGSAFLCAQLGISTSPRDDHAKYLNNWISVLKSDKKAIFSAAKLASKASQFIIEAGTEELQEAA